MFYKSKKMLSSVMAVLVFMMYALPAIAAGWIDPAKDLRSPLSAANIDSNITNVSTKIKNVCYDLQSEYPTSLYHLDADGKGHDAMCVAAARTAPGNNGKVYKLDVSTLKDYRGSNSRLLEASANLTATDSDYSVWWSAYYYSDLWYYNDEQVMRKIAWLIEDGNWTYYPLAKAYTADDLYDGIELDFNSPINDSNIYRDLRISKDAMSRYQAFSIANSRVGANISGLYGAAHAIASRIISGDRYHLSGTIYYSFTRTESDKATYLDGSHATYAYGDDGNGHDNNKYRRIQLTQYFNIIAHAPEYDGELYLYSPDQRSGVGQQWLLYVDRDTDHRSEKAYIRPAVDKDTPDGTSMNGAEFTVYSDSDLNNAIGVITDEDGNGYYSDYRNMETGDDQRDGLIYLDNNMDGTHSRTFYVKETKAPDKVTTSTGSRALLSEDLIDSKVYKVDMSYVYDTRKLSVTVSSEGNKVYSRTVKSYDAVDDPSNVYISNNGDGNFVDGAGLAVVKDTGTGFDVTGTLFALYKGNETDGDALAYYRFKDGWGWYKDKTGDDLIGKSYPVLPDSTYTLVEEYTPDCYGNTTIPYTVVNSSGWTRLGENRYSYTFTTEGAAFGDVVTVKCENDRVYSSITVSKASDDGVIEGRGFDVYYLGNGNSADKGEGILAAHIETNNMGMAQLGELPLGWYRIAETDAEDYRLTWQQGVTTREDDAIVHLTSANIDSVTVSAMNNLAVKLAVIKKDSETNEVLGGAWFRLHKDVNGNGILEASEEEDYIDLKDSDNDGIAMAEGVGVGKYLVKEYKAPAGYYKSDKVYPVNISGRTDKTVVIGGEAIRAYQAEVLNDRYRAPVYVYKTDSADKSLKLTGAMFNIYEDTNGNGEYDEGTDLCPKITEDGSDYDVYFAERNGRYETVYDNGTVNEALLSFGDYFIEEVVAPELYVKDPVIRKVTVEKVDTEEITEPVPVTVTFVNDKDFGTTLTGVGGSKNVMSSATSTLKDSVSYTNLIAGRTYTLKGELMVRLDDGRYERSGITATKAFTVKDNGNGTVEADGTTRVSGTVEVEFKLDTISLKGKSLVAFERLYYKTRLIGTHEDIDDEGQTVKIPDIGTVLVDSRTGTHTGQAATGASFTDTVRYDGLVKGDTYTITGVLMDADTGEALKDKDGNEIRSEEHSFVANDTHGEETVTFKLDTSDLQGKAVVAFEYLSYGSTVIASHEDLESRDQTVLIPELVTTATSEGSKFIDLKGNIHVTDKVHYENLTPGVTYIMDGVLMHSGTGAMYYDPNNNIVRNVVEFVPDTAEGFVDVEFTFDASNLEEGDKLVVYETGYMKVNGAADEDGRVLLCEHRDPYNTDQTVTVRREIPQTGDDGIDKGYVAGLIASLGVVIAVIGIGSVMTRKKIDSYERPAKDRY